MAPAGLATRRQLAAAGLRPERAADRRAGRLDLPALLAAPAVPHAGRLPLPDRPRRPPPRADHRAAGGAGQGRLRPPHLPHLRPGPAVRDPALARRMPRLRRPAHRRPRRPEGSLMTTPTHRDRWTYGGMLAVAVAAAVLSFSALAGLAELAGVTAAAAAAGRRPVPAGVAAADRGGRLRGHRDPGVAAHRRHRPHPRLRPPQRGRRDRASRRRQRRVPRSGRRRGRIPGRRPRPGGPSWSPSPRCRRSCSAWSDTCTPWSPTTTAPRRPRRTRPAPTPAPSRPVPAGRPARTGGRTGRPYRYAYRPAATPARTDAELTAALAELPREPDGTVPIRRATAALGCGPDRARRLLAAAGLLRTHPTATAAAGRRRRADRRLSREERP